MSELEELRTRKTEAEQKIIAILQELNDSSPASIDSACAQLTMSRGIGSSRSDIVVTSFHIDMKLI